MVGTAFLQLDHECRRVGHLLIQLGQHLEESFAFCSARHMALTVQAIDPRRMPISGLMSRQLTTCRRVHFLVCYTGGHGNEPNLVARGLCDGVTIDRPISRAARRQRTPPWVSASLAVLRRVYAFTGLVYSTSQSPQSTTSGSVTGASAGRTH
jgi:hypothetical protein